MVCHERSLCAAWAPITPVKAATLWQLNACNNIQNHQACITLNAFTTKPARHQNVEVADDMDALPVLLRSHHTANAMLHMVHM